MNKDTLGTAEAPVQSTQKERVLTAPVRYTLDLEPSKAYLSDDGSSFGEVFDGFQETNHRNAAAELVRRANAYDALVALLGRVAFDPMGPNDATYAGYCSVLRDEARALLPTLEEVQNG